MTHSARFIGGERSGPPMLGSVEDRARLAHGPCWRFVAMAEIVNFDVVRRSCGAARIAGLAGAIADRMREVRPDIEIALAGRRQIEIQFEGGRIRDSDTVLTTLQTAVDSPFELGGRTVHIDLVFGLAFAPLNTADTLTLVEEAEASLAEAVASVDKTNGQSESARETRRIASELVTAIARDELLLQYQPKVNVRKQEITSVEALVRWRHPERGMIFPGDFISAAEQTGMIGQLTLWTLRQAITDQRRLAEAGFPLRVFVNISGQLVSDPVFVQEICALVEGADALLGFEITETSVIRDPRSAITHLQAFADIGVTIAIDDYGAGLSSLAYLKQLPARELKIDKLFITQLTSSNRDPLIVRSTIDLAHAMEMEVVAEGVETHAALALLTVMGCDMVQGFLISRPIEFDKLVTFLAEDRYKDTPRETRETYRQLAHGWKRA